MVRRVIKFSNHKKILAISCTGQAGPKILNKNFPIGTVFIGVSYKEKILSFKKCYNLKDRKSVINSTVNEMIDICLKIVKS